MRVLAVDPGPEQSAWVLYEVFAGAYGKPIRKGLEKNPTVLEVVQANPYYHLAIEMIASYGMPVGKSVFDTCVWVGRFIQAQLDDPVAHGDHTLVYRRHVKMFLCNSMKATDSNVRQALIDKFPPTGGGKTPEIGTKAKPGPLYGFKQDLWAALGVAVTFAHSPEFQEVRGC